MINWIDEVHFARLMIDMFESYMLNALGINRTNYVSLRRQVAAIIYRYY